MAGTARSFVVLGAAGAIGRVVVKDLFETHPQNCILVADCNEQEALSFARKFRSRRVRGQFADCSQIGELAKTLKEFSVVVNCTHHRLNLGVMNAALRAGTHYLDLGGLFYWTRRQLRLHRAFKKAGLTALLGVGCAPGITNLMAQQAIELMERVDSVKIRVGSRDLAPQSAGFCFPYSARTIIEELTLPPWIWTGDRFQQMQPRSGWERIDFGHPLGRLWTVRTRHSEVATLPLSFRKKGIRHCDFKVSFERSFVREIMKRKRAGWTIREFSKLPASREQVHDYEIARVVATGWELDSQGSVEATVECHSQAKPEWSASAGDIDTACPASIAAQMVATGAIEARGVFPPENVLPAGPFIRELERRGMRWILGVRYLSPV